MLIFLKPSCHETPPRLDHRLAHGPKSVPAIFYSSQHENDSQCTVSLCTSCTWSWSRCVAREPVPSEVRSSFLLPTLYLAPLHHLIIIQRPLLLLLLFLAPPSHNPTPPPISLLKRTIYKQTQYQKAQPELNWTQHSVKIASLTKWVALTLGQNQSCCDQYQ